MTISSFDQLNTMPEYKSIEEEKIWIVGPKV